jgi:spermidine/putrescine transport system permease protein
LKHWTDPFVVPGLQDALVNSLFIGAVATGIAVVLGIGVALALVRHKIRGRSAIDSLVLLPLATPEVVLGAALLGYFLTLGFARGFVTILIAHVMFTLGYVVLTVRARLEGLDLHIEEAAMDLGANQWTTLRRVTLPLIAPGIAAAALLAFAISLDDFVITSFTAGQTETFPLFVYGAARQGVPPQVNVVATGLLLLVIVLLFVNLAVQRRAGNRDAAASLMAR